MIIVVMTREELELAYKELRVKLVEKNKELNTVESKFMDLRNRVGRYCNKMCDGPCEDCPLND